MQSGSATVRLERDSLQFVFKAVPAQICPRCGEAYVSEAVATQLLDSAEELVRTGAQMDIRLFAPAASS
ncbi:MAG: type II toxin-antitoxin system MqsA family antitoxin [Chloroflexi bacterium]|nr:type II toxin-antitoxin system MqsA family antitoxin [Chloroflexota bacterium]